MFYTFSFQKNPIYFFISFTTDKIAICLGFYSSSEQHLYWRLVELKEVEFFFTYEQLLTLNTSKNQIYLMNQVELSRVMESNICRSIFTTY